MEDEDEELFAVCMLWDVYFSDVASCLPWFRSLFAICHAIVLLVGDFIFCLNFSFKVKF